MIHPKAILTLAAVAAFPAFIIFSKGNFAANVKVENNTEGFNTAAASWTLDNSTQTVNIQLRPGESANVHYDINAKKELVNSVSGAKGNVCVKNNGKEQIENLNATTKIQSRERLMQFKDVDSPQVNQTFDSIAPRSTSCQDFQIVFTAQANAQKYRAISSVTFTKVGKKETRDIVRHDSEMFTIPPGTSSSEAEISDDITCPTGYTCQSSGASLWKVTDTQTIGYDLTITNNNAACEEPTELVSTAILKELVTNNTVTSESKVPINTGPC